MHRQKGDVDLAAKFDEWERFHNFATPHGAHNGQTIYEVHKDTYNYTKDVQRARLG